MRSEAEAGLWPQQQLQEQEQEGKREELAAEQQEREGEQQEREEVDVEKREVVAEGGGEAGQGSALQAFCSALGRRGAKGTLSVVLEGSVGAEVERSAPSFSSHLVRPLDILPPEVVEAAVEAANAEAKAAADAAAEAKGAGADAEAAVAAAAVLRAEEAAAAAKAAGSAAQASRAAPSTRAKRKKALAFSEDVGGVGGGQAQPHTWTRPATVVSPFAAPAEIPEDSAAPGVEGDARGGAALQQQQQQQPWLGSPLARSATSASPTCHGAGGAKEQLEHISEW